ncbi:uncharacterized protein LOC106665691 [Cimex lectularius]|uniref:Uncharacterized protein n=1 Tax=Cimex lectularius TaxID=79782 RepID=A0A8I6TFZ3_CIMLE|nr:uncharacterized protein LOC106665691 [Cimex lectularius]
MYVLGVALFTFASLAHISQCADYYSSLVIDSLHDCPEENIGQYFNMRDLRLSINGDHSVINGRFTFNGQMPGQHNVRAVLTVEKCNHKASLETCEKVSDFQFNDPCSTWHSKGKLWSSAVASVSPRLECRMKNNVYTVNNWVINGDVFKQTIPQAEKFYWRLKLKLYFNNQLRLCGKVTGGFQKFPGRRG